MKPKSRKEILDVCQNHFWNYSTFNKIAIILALLLSAGAVALYLCGYVLPTIQGIVWGEIVGWNIVWRLCLMVILYFGLNFVNLLSVSLGGAIMCREEQWDINDFSMAWMNMYEFEKYLNDDGNLEE
jgi:hypothetical protein